MKSISFFQRVALLCFVNLTACAHGPVLSPEITDTGTKSVHGGVVYSIPAHHAVMKMMLVSLGLNDKKMLHVRMYFHRLGSPAGEYMDPREQTLSLPDSGLEIHPAGIHAYTNNKPVISLAEPEKQVVELLFPMPAGGSEFSYINLHWKVHYLQMGKPQTMSQTERYDYVEKFTQRGVGDYSADPEFPGVQASIFPDDPDWVGAGWRWW